MADKPQSRPVKPGASRQPARGARTRRAEIRRTVPKPKRSLREWVVSPEFKWGAPIALVFAILAGSLSAWSREQPLVAPDRIMSETRVVRADFTVEDASAAEARRTVARQTAPRVYKADRAVFEEIESALIRLPTALADAQSLEEVAPKIRQAYQLNEDQLAAIREHAVAGQASQTWRSRVESLLEQLRAAPVLARETFQIEQQAANEHIELRAWDADPIRRLKSRAINVAGGQLRRAMRQAVIDAGFEEPIATVIANWLVDNARPTFTFDSSATEKVRDQAAAEVQPHMVEHTAGRVIYRRGERLSQEAHRLLLAEHRAFPRVASVERVWAPRAAVFGVALLIAMACAAYLGRFCPRVTRNPLRVAAIAGLLLLTLALSVWIGVAGPSLMWLALTAPPTLAAVILVIAYDQRTALALGSLAALLVGTALGQPMLALVAPLVGIGAVVWKLRDVRHRNDLIRAGGFAAVAMAVAVVLISAASQPIVSGIWLQIAMGAGWTLAGGMLVGALTLAILPSIERIFDITTGMTLIELRDPKQPLLRQLQQRAPGTYNHSLSVAAIAENAAEAIGADSLHLYVGALYHDIGKMNKPDYFVENQAAGVNRHNRLSPAMSLLVIVGHVKDGVELAREYNLPRSLHHYIESHHGTTLVEYFYHRAKERAGEAQSPGPDEVEYRYPGPKPRTKEAAILMLADAVESAMRAMAEPTPRRIEQLVHSLAQRRLADGQFDDCDLTLRELHTIEQSLTKSLNSIYHGRIAYPGSPAGARRPEAPPQAPPRTQPEHPQPRPAPAG